MYITSSDENNCLYQCPTHYYNSSGVCGECLAKCTGCKYKADNCTACESGYWMQS